jgi:hypothetical protein
MADLKISALTASTTPLAGTEVLPIVQSSTTKQVSVANLTAGRAVSMQSVTANNTGLATPVGNFQSGDQAGSRVAIINSGAGGQTYHLVTGNPGVSNSGFALFDSTNSATRLYVGSSTGDLTLNTGNLVVSNGKGIDFSGTPGTGTSELLADYEEGTYTATITVDTGSVTVDPTFNTLSYTKVGRVVVVTGTIVISSVSTPTGFAAINLPFTSANLTQGASRSTASTSTQGFSTINSNETALQLTPNSALLYLTNTSGNSSTGAAMGQQLLANSVIAFTLSYITA